ncbi:MAG: CBS domain-containing protein [Syntrophomonadales bacterium]
MTRIKDVMSSPVITVSPRHSIQEALEIMRDNDTRRLPVIDRGKLVGMLVQHDIENALRSPGRIPHTPVEWVMTKKVRYVSPEDTIPEAARIMRSHKISALPVIDAGKLVGIITDTDLLQVLINLLEPTEPN